jgi:hypothetical protein
VLVLGFWLLASGGARFVPNNFENGHWGLKIYFYPPWPSQQMECSGRARKFFSGLGCNALGVDDDA